jgi:hypothetical protein
MGYNTLVAINGAAFAQIEHDVDFGEKLRLAVIMSQSRADKSTRHLVGSGIHLSEIDANITKHDGGYDIQAAVPHHANQRAIHAIDNGRFWTLGSPRPFRAYEVLAARLSQFGMLIHKTDDDFMVRPAKVDAMDSACAEATLSDGFSKGALEAGLVTFIVSNDALNEFGSDKRLGTRIAQRVNDWWDTNRFLMGQILKGEIPKFGTSLESISSGNHSNPIHIIGVTPAGSTDVIVTSDNWGRKMQRHLTANDSIRRLNNIAHNERMSAALSSDVDAAVDLLLRSGFSVKTSETAKLQKPKSSNKDYWVTKTVEAPQPEGPNNNEDLSGSGMRP